MYRSDRCACGARYGDLRTGLTFSGVAQMIKTNDPASYRQLRRRSILGAWREYKLLLWASIHGACA